MDLSIVIKTFNRKKSLIHLLRSISIFYPTLPILISDDGIFRYSNKSHILRKFQHLNIDYVTTKFDIGVSAGRNILLNRINTKYFLLCDDDYILDKRSMLEKVVFQIQDNNFDILGGRVYDIHRLNSLISLIQIFFKKNRIKEIMNKTEIDVNLFYKTQIKNKKIEYIDITSDLEKNDILKVDYLPQFFVAKTDRIKEIGGWLPETLKTYEHGLFLLKAQYNNLQVYASRDFGCKSIRYTPIIYFFFRYRPKKKIEQIISFEKSKLISSYEKKLPRLD